MSDMYEGYEATLQKIVDEAKSRELPVHEELLTYQQRLCDNIKEARRHGNTEYHRAEHSKITDQLNRVCTGSFGKSFNDLLYDFLNESHSLGAESDGSENPSGSDQTIQTVFGGPAYERHRKNVEQEIQALEKDIEYYRQEALSITAREKGTIRKILKEIDSDCIENAHKLTEIIKRINGSITHLERELGDRNKIIQFLCQVQGIYTEIKEFDSDILTSKGDKGDKERMDDHIEWIERKKIR